MAVPSSATLSLNDLPTHYLRPNLNRTMSLPYVKKRLQVFRRDSIKRRKIARDSGVSFQLGGDLAPLSTSPATDDGKDQAPVTIVPQVSFPTRKTSLVQQWLIQQSERFGRLRHRYDSVSRFEDVQKELKLASEEVNSIVEGPGREPFPAYVIDDFFKLYSAGGSDWRESWRWEIHLKRWEDHQQHCFEGDCSYCRTLCKVGEAVPPPYVVLLSPTQHTSSPKSPELPKEPKGSQDSYFSPLWRRRSHRRREKGKGLALDQEYYIPVDEALISPRMQPLELPPVRPRAPRAPENGVVIREAVQSQQRKPVRCSFSATPLDPRQIPVPATPDLYPEDSGALNLSDLSHVTGRPYGASPLEEGRLSFPLPKILLPPPTPGLRPEQRLTPVPEPLKLEDSSRAISNGALFDKSPLTRFSPKATKVQRGGFPTLVNASSTTPQSALAVLFDQLHNNPAAPKSKKRRPVPRNPSPSIKPLPTPPDSRNNSGSNQSGVLALVPNGIPDISFGDTGSIPARPRPRRAPTPEEPADRDPKVCTLSDTTGSPLPDCPVYMNPWESRDRRNGRMARRHWPGGCI